MWMQTVGDLDTTGPWYTSLITRLNILVEGVIIFYTEIFFCHRLWAISHNVYVVVFTMVLYIFALAASGVVTYFFTNHSLATIWTDVRLGVSLGADLLLTGSIVFYLRRHTKTVLPRGPTAPILMSLLWLTIQAAAVCTLMDFVFILLEHTGGLLGPSMGSIVFQALLPKLYGVSAMWTLNSREDMHPAVDKEQYTFHPELPHSEPAVQLQAGGNSMVDHQEVQDISVSLGTAEKFQQSGLKARAFQW
ncbi:hypothetical protein DFH08DRAFT_1077379 [Mycena albidolilacea]|uniref:DUF6534 domain-containing protein n=1 Tax=Mycena albidolilacea TaxID=1033008 RepID=A0AAD7EV61_9AGAR|nr:hypothetical protein DFH08DRAFT_1077379 [Mycena albidolilacea]